MNRRLVLGSLSASAIKELSARIKDKRADEVRAAIIERLGQPQRNIGYGYRIEQWDTSDGVLTFQPITDELFPNLRTKHIFDFSSPGKTDFPQLEG